jgi:HEPN domain-containing protein
MKEEVKANAKIRLKDAFEFLESAKRNFEEGRYKSALLDSGDAAIAANDALTIFFLEKVASRDHQEAFFLHKEVGKRINENRLSILQSLITARHQKGYRVIIVSKALAEENIKNAIKFVNWVVEKLRKEGIEL